MTYAEEYKDIVKAGRKESKDLGQKAQNAVIDTFALMDKADAEIARLNALLAEAREGLEMCERNDRSEPYGYANKGAPEASYRRAGDGAVPEVGKRWKTPREIARAILAKLGA